MEVVDVDIAHQDVCLFREVFMEVVDVDIAHQDVCLFVQRGHRGGCGCRESTPRCLFVCHSERSV